MKKTRKNVKRIMYLIFLLIFLLNIIYPKKINADTIMFNNDELDKEFLNINAPNVLLTETETGKILYKKNENEKIYPASLTKLMTAILVVENCQLDEIVTVSENAVNSVPVGYVNANLQIGEELTIEDLLCAMLIPSANDAANVLAEYVGGSIESFATMMNTKAAELGCENTNFTNPSGLHQTEHVSTAKDIGIIANEAIKNQILKNIMGTTKYTLPKTNKYSKDDRVFTTTNYMKIKNMTKFYTDYCIAAKTGYTQYAKNCVVEYAEKDGIKLTAVILGESSQIKGQKFLDAKILFEKIYNNYEYKNVINKGDVIDEVEIQNATKNTKKLKLIANDSIKVLILKGKSLDINKSIEQNIINAPISMNEVVGKLKYEYESETYEINIIAGNNVEVKENNLILIIIIIICIFILHIMKKSNKKSGNHGKKIKK